MATRRRDQTFRYEDLWRALRALDGQAVTVERIEALLRHEPTGLLESIRDFNLPEIGQRGTHYGEGWTRAYNEAVAALRPVEGTDDANVVARALEGLRPPERMGAVTDGYQMCLAMIRARLAALLGLPPRRETAAQELPSRHARNLANIADAEVIIQRSIDIALDGERADSDPSNDLTLIALNVLPAVARAWTMLGEGPRHVIATALAEMLRDVLGCAEAADALESRVP